MITNREKAFVHIYAGLAGLSDVERRKLMVRRVGVYSSKEMDQEQYEHAMAELEEIYWDRVDHGVVPDNRLCTVCTRPLQKVRGGRGKCREGCEERKVYAWTRDYWRSRLPQDKQANSRLQWKLRQLWDLASDFLPEENRTDRYLASIICKSSAIGQRNLVKSGSLDWTLITAGQAHRAIEALKDRLNYATKETT